MLSLADVIAQHTDLTTSDVAELERLVDEWDLLADLSFSDLILWVPDRDPNIFWAAAQVRPMTGPTALEDDVVGDDIAYEFDSVVMEAFLSRGMAQTSGNKLQAGIPVDQHAFPITRGGRVIAIIEMHTNRMGVRAPGALEETYLDVAGIVTNMMIAGVFPMRGETPVPWISPRLVDGCLRIDSGGNITFASPNAVSAFRRLGVPGDLLGEEFKDVLASLPAESRGPTDTSVSGRAGRPHEFDLDSSTAAVRLRVQPLLCANAPCGYLIMVRDTTELRSRERELVTKDATIREIHHRVKNNLQTVSALLRLQARRTGSDEARNALSDAQKRVSAIAVVHEILSQEFDSSVRFDTVCDRLLSMVREVAAAHHIAIQRVGTFGFVPAAAATSLSLALTEITQNALEHGVRDTGGTVVVRPEQRDGRLVVVIENDGTALPDDFCVEESDRLGLSIVMALVADLDGDFTITPIPDGAGTRATIDIPVA